MYVRIHDAGTGRYPPRVALALRSPGWGIASSQWGWGSTPCGDLPTRGIASFVPGLLEL